MKAVIALGSNLGDRWAHLASGLEALKGLGAVLPSPLVMETPDESGRGPVYLNTVALLDTPEADPRRLVEARPRPELRLGRERRPGPHGRTTLDLDLITTDGEKGHWTWAAPEDLAATLGAELSLELPHPRAFSRSFVLEPWRALSDPGACGGVIPKG